MAASVVGSPSNDLDTQIQKFVTLQRELLAAELASESYNGLGRRDESTEGSTENIQQARTQILRNLVLDQVSVGLYGCTVVHLTLDPTNVDCKNRLRLLPPHRFTTGDEVLIVPKSSGRTNKGTVLTEKTASPVEGGVVCQVDETSISISLFTKNQTPTRTSDNDDETTILGSPPFNIVPQSSVDVHNKMLQALRELERNTVSHPLYGNVVRSIFSSHNEARPIPEVSNVTNPFNATLDESQVEAISFALRGYNDSHVLSLIHGPPGTGKTSTVAELIQQAVHHHNYKVLVTAPSNVAVDNVLERIIESQSKQRQSISRSGNKSKRSCAAPSIRAVRIGHPARIKPSIFQYSLEAQVQNADGTEIVRNVREELQSHLQVLLRSTKLKGGNEDSSLPKKKKTPLSRGGGLDEDVNSSSKRAAYRQVKLLRQEIRQRETKVVQTLLDEAQVVLCTTVGAANKLLKDMQFDMVIIDEAAQALEASCWIPILKGKRLVLAGDHCQLPPTVKCQDETVQQGLSLTLFERILNIYKEKRDLVSRMLKVQYRMHKDIADWASQNMYNGELRTHESVAHHRISDLETFSRPERQDELPPAMMLIDTGGCGMEECVTLAGSRFNEGEAQVVVRHVKSLLTFGVPAEQIAVISPYNGQVELLRTLLLEETSPKLEIRSVDGFQGGEREAVVLSLVRSNPNRVLGFLNDTRRLNVAVTRARRHCAVVCDTETVSSNNFIATLLNWIEERGDYRSAIEFLPSSGDADGDLKLAERELTKISRITKTSNDSVFTKSSNRETSSKEGVDRINAVIQQICQFAKTSCPGESLILSNDLSKSDRRRIHEHATELGIDHKSEGVEGVDRHVVLSIPEGTAGLGDSSDIAKRGDGISSNPHPQQQESSRDEAELHIKSMIGELIGHDDDDKDKAVDEVQTSVKPVPTPSDMNSLLSSLAFERLQRQQRVAEHSPANIHDLGKASASAVGIEKKGKARRLGGRKTPKLSGQCFGDDDVNLVNEDSDIAFLNSQIEQVQNSHGRKIEATGNGYRTIINGILLSKPQPGVSTAKKSNNPKKAALHAKLRAAQEERKVKHSGTTKKNK